jgi:glucan phosphoethanolaminetransferase (alkaline phosphatase superfamily)
MTELGFNYLNIAENYSQIAGLMAGFSFAAIGVLLSARPADNRVEFKSTAILALLVGLAVFLLTSFVFGRVVAQEQKTFSVILHFVGSNMFAVGASILFAALSWLSFSYELARTLVSFSRLMACGVAIVSYANGLFSGKLMMFNLMYAPEVISGNYEIISLFFIVLLLPSSKFMKVFLNIQRSNEKLIFAFRMTMMLVLLMSICVGVSVAVIAGWPIGEPAPLVLASSFASLPDGSFRNDLRTIMSKEGEFHKEKSPS